MARGRNSHHGAGGGGALLACNRAIDRQDEYTSNVKKIQARATTMADLLMEDSDVVKVLRESSGDGGADDWLLLNRNRLKDIAEGNAKRMNEIECFVDAVKEVRSDVQRRQDATQAGGGGEEGGEDPTNDNDVAPDYEGLIHGAMDRIREQRESDPSRPSIEDHEMYVEVRQRLGEKIQKKRSRASRGGDDDDDDLEIVQNAIDDVNSLKCPITGMLFEDPVKNKACHHTYDRAGLNQLLGARKHTCPVPGCANKTVSMAQVEDDEEMKLKVKRHRAREEAEKRKRDLEDEDEDEDGAEAGGYTKLE